MFLYHMFIYSDIQHKMGSITVDLNSSMARKNGEIRLGSGVIFSLANNTSVILTGAVPASHTAGVSWIPLLQ
jgi:hypothetical protein